jgi:lipopolysaccharide export LptBFGC system permease protein LptF
MIRKRATALSSIGISILVGFSYYILDAVSIALGRGGYVAPVLAVSLSHIIALISSLYFINSLP